MFDLYKIREQSKGRTVAPATEQLPDRLSDHCGGGNENRVCTSLQGESAFLCKKRMRGSSCEVLL